MKKATIFDHNHTFFIKDEELFVFDRGDSTATLPNGSFEFEIIGYKNGIVTVKVFCGGYDLVFHIDLINEEYSFEHVDHPDFYRKGKSTLVYHNGLQVTVRITFNGLNACLTCPFLGERNITVYNSDKRYAYYELLEMLNN